jgi:hypothetical protein
MIVRGRRIDAEKALRRAATRDETPAVVPKSWELVVRDRQGAEDVIARGVVDFDLTDDGAPIWTNGTAIFQRDPEGRPRVVERGKLIDAVTVLAA